MIEVRNLTKKFGDLVVLEDISFDVGKGEVISIIGPSGTGKSTLLRCINLLEQPDSGQISVGGLVLQENRQNITKARKKMAMVFQSFNLFSHLMVVENVMIGPVELLRMPRQEAFENALKYLGMVGLREKAYSFPDELSGGQKQRVAIARALSMNPDILLFDEPTSALDPTMVGEVLAVIRNLAKEGLTMLIVTHEMKFARDVSSRVFYMDEKGIYEDGPPEQIFDSPKKDKTRAFIRQIKTCTIEIGSHDFDYYQMNADLEAFGRKQLIPPKLFNEIQLVCEELLLNKLLPVLPDPPEITLTLGYTLEGQRAELSFVYKGVEYDPFTAVGTEGEEIDDLSMMIVRSKAREVSYSYEGGTSRLQFSL